MTVLELLQYGPEQIDLALRLNSVVLGVFFAIAGYHKLFNAERHAMLERAFNKLGIPFVRFNLWFVPLVEFMGGLALISGVLAPLASLGLIAICVVATCTDGRKRLVDKHPIDLGDKVNLWLYMPEVLYIVALLIVLLAGAGSPTLVDVVL